MTTTFDQPITERPETRREAVVLDQAAASMLGIERDPASDEH